MKLSLIALVTTFSFSSAFAQTVKHNYQCIADRLEAYNSDIYYALTPAEIDDLLTTRNDTRSAKVIEVAKFCDVPDYTNLSATFREVYETQVDDISIEQDRSLTALEVVKQYGPELTLKTTKKTRWSGGSKFIDIRSMTLDLGNNQGKDALLKITEIDGNNMGSFTTRLVLNCKAEAKSINCSTGNFKLLIK